MDKPKRPQVADPLIEAKQTIPHFYLTADVAIDRLLEVRAEANEAARQDTDGNPSHRLSVNDFIIKALAMALRAVPSANAVWAEDRILRFRHADIGVAVALDGMTLLAWLPVLALLMPRMFNDGRAMSSLSVAGAPSVEPSQSCRIKSCSMSGARAIASRSRGPSAST